ncbi:hypothetical protein ES703_104333 [subsurface metagenome]
MENLPMIHGPARLFPHRICFYKEGGEGETLFLHLATDVDDVHFYYRSCPLTPSLRRSYLFFCVSTSNVTLPIFHSIGD